MWMRIQAAVEECRSQQTGIRHDENSGRCGGGAGVEGPTNRNQARPTSFPRCPRSDAKIGVVSRTGASVVCYVIISPAVTWRRYGKRWISLARNGILMFILL